MKQFAMLVLSALLLSVTAHGGQSYHEECWTGTDAQKETPTCVKEIAKAAKAQKKREAEQAKRFAKDEDRQAKLVDKGIKFHEQFPELDATQIAAIVRHQIFVGMTVAELRASQTFPIVGTIFPMATNTTVTANGVLQQEVYGAFNTVTMYVYITNGIVTSYQLMR